MDFQDRWPPRQYDASYPEQNFQLKCQMFKNIRFLSSAPILTSMCWDCVSSLSALFCVRVCFCMCVHMLGPEVSVGYLPVSFSTLLQRSLTELRVHQSDWSGQPVNFRIRLSPLSLPRDHKQVLPCWVSFTQTLGIRIQVFMLSWQTRDNQTFFSLFMIC